MARNIQSLCISADTKIIDALEKLQETGIGILVLTNKHGQLQRTVTDGDLRRMMLTGRSLSDTLEGLDTTDPVYEEEAIDVNRALAAMDLHQVDHLPLVNTNGVPTDVLLRREIDKKLLLSTPHLGDQEMKFVSEAFRSNWIAPLGPNVDAFEQELAAHVNIGHAAALCSGTAALHLALNILGVAPGDTVFCSSLTFIASAAPVLYQRATPVLIDSDPATWNMSPVALAKALESAKQSGQLPKAVVVVNLYGQSADIDEIQLLCDPYGIPVIEDAAESLGATYKGKSSGTLGRMGFYSFNGNKIITTSGGGMLVSDDETLIKKARFLSTQAKDDVPWYEHSELGYNYRMSNVLAGIGRGQLRVLEDRVASRRAVFERYQQELKSYRAISWMPEADYGRSTRWLSVGLISPDHRLSAKEIIASLSNEGIEARHVWKPMHMQPIFASYARFPHFEDTFFADTAFANGICLPSGSNMTADQQMRVVRVLQSLLSDH